MCIPVRVVETHLAPRNDIVIIAYVVIDLLFDDIIVVGYEMRMTSKCSPQLEILRRRIEQRFSTLVQFWLAPISYAALEVFWKL